MRQHHLPPVLVIFLSFFFSFHTAAQSTIKGVVTEEFPVKEGKIKVYLPDDIRPGETISGSVVAEPNGSAEKEKKRNAEALGKYKLSIGIETTPLRADQRQYFKLLSVSPGISVNLVDENNKTVSSYPVTFKEETLPAPFFLIPTHVLAGSPLIIHGPFDGDASDTKCRIDGKEIEVIAESSRQSICDMPVTNSGPHIISIEENKTITEKKISAVNLDLSAGRTNLRKGEKTTLKIEVSGLQGLKEPIKITLANTSPSIITLSGGNTQVIPVTPSQVSSNGTYTQTFEAQSLSTGNFSVSADLDLPEPAAMTNGNAVLCNCYINQHSYLVPPQTCLSLGGSPDQPSLPDNPVSQPGSASTNPPVVSFPAPGAMNTETGQVPLQVIAPANDVAAVIFSERPVWSREWNPVGYAVNNGNNWQYNWDTPLGSDGEHVIRARIAGKNNTVIEKFTQTLVQVTAYSINPLPGEKINLTITDRQIKDADQKTKRIIDSLRKLQEKLDAWQKKYDELQKKQSENSTMAGELETIDRVIDQVPGIYSDSLKVLTDSLDKLKSNLPPKIDPAALQKTADDAAQREKDCRDRLNKLKEEKDKAQKELDDFNKKIEDLLNKMDQLHLGNNWTGGHGYHADGSFWYGYVGDERSNTNIGAQSNAIANQLRGLRAPQNKANNRAKNLDKEIANAEAECDKLAKEKEKAEKAAKDGNQYAAAETQVDELCRQIDALMSALREWCAAHPGICNFDPRLPANPRSPSELQAYLDKLNDIIEKKKQKEADLKNEADKNGSEAQSTGDKIKEGQGDKENLEGDKSNAQAEADSLRAQREKQLEEEREKLRKKQEEEEIKRNTPKPVPTLPQPINPTEKQLKFAGISKLIELHRDSWVNNGPCHCITKALALSKATNPGAAEVLGGLAVGIIFAPLEAFPGLSFATKLGLGAMKAIGSALYGGEKFTDELAKNLFNVIGGEIFPKLLGSDVAGNSANTFAGKGLEEILKEEGIRASSWEGETEVRSCGKVKGKTTMLFNPNTGWVTLLIKVEGCPLVVVKYKVNKDGVPLSDPPAVVKTVKG